MARWAMVRLVENRARDALADDVGHRGDVLGRGGIVLGSPVAHHVGADGAVGDLGPDVHRELERVQVVQVLGEALPLPGDALGEGGAGDVLDALHQADEPVVAVGRRRANPTPQLPMTSVVTPCQLEGRSTGSQVTWPS